MTDVDSYTRDFAGLEVLSNCLKIKIKLDFNQNTCYYQGQALKLVFYFASWFVLKGRSICQKWRLKFRTMLNFSERRMSLWLMEL